MVKIIQVINKVQQEDDKSIENFFSEKSLNNFSTKYTYDKCGVKKISASSFVQGFLKMFQEGKNNLHTLSLHIGLIAQTTIESSSCSKAKRVLIL